MVDALFRGAANCWGVNICIVSHRIQHPYYNLLIGKFLTTRDFLKPCAQSTFLNSIVTDAVIPGLLGLRLSASVRDASRLTGTSQEFESRLEGMDLG
jgi:hypothetical protein